MQEHAPAMAFINSSISAAPIYTLIHAVVLGGLSLSPTSVPQMNTAKLRVLQMPQRRVGSRTVRKICKWVGRSLYQAWKSFHQGVCKRQSTGLASAVWTPGLAGLCSWFFLEEGTHATLIKLCDFINQCVISSAPLYSAESLIKV